MRAARSRSARGQAIFAAGMTALLVATIVLLDRAGPKAPASAVAGSASSGAWLCPHGGGRGWTVALFLANPGQAPVVARVGALGGARSDQPDVIEVPGRGSVRVDLSAEARASATYVEYFGGWIGAGWVALTEDREGTAAEPCAAEAARRWYLADGTTQQGEDAFVIIANPFDVRAVLDVALYTSDRAPIRPSDWTDLVVRPRQSIALHLNGKVEGETAVAAELAVSVGRVAVASLGVTDRTRVRSSLGWAEQSTVGIFPVMGGSGQTELLLLSTSDGSIRFGATTLSDEPPAPAGGLTEQEHGPSAAHAYAVPVAGGPAAIDLFTLDDASVAAAVRALGPGEDPGATAGTVSPSESWVILPAVAAGRARPGAVLVNAGDAAVAVSLEVLPRGGGTAATPITVSVPAHSAAAVPRGFLEGMSGAAVIARSAGGPIVALAASTSIGKGGRETFALSLGLPLPRPA